MRPLSFGRALATACAGAALILTSACSQNGGGATSPLGGGRTGGASVRRAADVASGPTCTGTDAHPKHASAPLNIGCERCHPCGGQVGFTSGFVYPRGTPASGTVVLGTPTTCSVACHSPMGAPPHTIAWAAPPAPLACVDCHDTSLLPWWHTTYFQHSPPTRDDCLLCHDMSAHTTGKTIAAGHPPSWIDQSSPGFHAYSVNQNILQCTQCHGATLDGDRGRACGACHDSMLPAGVASWKTNCVMCHGGTDNQTGAPPRAQWGYNVPADPTNLRIGAHSSHVQASHGLTVALGCESCHVMPADALSAGHVDGATIVTGYTGTDPTRRAKMTDPGWTAASARCGTSYCHGVTLAGGTNKMPLWTAPGTGQADCGTCHGSPPQNIYGHQYHRDCQRCHFDTAWYDYSTGRATITNPARHMNGVVDVVDLNNLPDDCLYCHLY
jgi:predicted CxxxxCH...CXXCH cytochrome family protein